MRFIALFLLLVIGQANAHARAADLVLAPGGTLRAAYIVTNIAQGRLDPATGTVTGVIADLTREIGRRADTPVSIEPRPTALAVLEAVRKGEADIGFVAPNPERTGIVLYSQPYMLVQQSALVRADSPLRSVHDLDRAGQVIGVNTDDSVGLWLQQRLTAARLRATPDFSLRDGVRWLRDGEIVAFAGGRQRIAAATRDVPNLRLLDDNFYGVPQSIAVAIGHEDRLAIVDRAIDELRASGFLGEAIARSGIDGLVLAPAR